jgi:hypothetical protein
MEPEIIDGPMGLYGNGQMIALQRQTPASGSRCLTCPAERSLTTGNVGVGSGTRA